MTTDHFNVLLFVFFSLLFLLLLFSPLFQFRFTLGKRVISLSEYGIGFIKHFCCCCCCRWCSYSIVASSCFSSSSSSPHRFIHTTIKASSPTNIGIQVSIQCIACIWPTNSSWYCVARLIHSIQCNAFICIHSYMCICGSIYNCFEWRLSTLLKYVYSFEHGAWQVSVKIRNKCISTINCCFIIIFFLLWLLLLLIFSCIFVTFAKCYDLCPDVDECSNTSEVYNF